MSPRGLLAAGGSRGAEQWADGVTFGCQAWPHVRPYEFQKFRTWALLKPVDTLTGVHYHGGTVPVISQTAEVARVADTPQAPLVC